MDEGAFKNTFVNTQIAGCSQEGVEKDPGNATLPLVSKPLHLLYKCDNLHTGRTERPCHTSVIMFWMSALI